MRLQRIAWFLAACGALLICGCPGPEHAEPLSPQALSAMTATYPAIVDTQEVRDQAVRNELVTLEQDAQCAFMEMTDDLLAQRPEGLGCPRPEGDPANWNAQ